MGKRSRAGHAEQRSATEQAPPPQGQKTRRILWAAALVIITVVNIVFLCSYRSTRGPASDANGKNADDPRTSEVKELIQRYFRTWSNQDSTGYRECFLENCSIQYIDAEGNVKQFALPEFLAGQDAVFRAERHETESPESIDIRFEADLARVVVYWKLTADLREVYGYDHFTVLKRDGKWGIMHLVWYATKHSG